MHTDKYRKKLLDRASRIRGQVEAIQRSLETDTDDCAKLLNMMAACRGAMAGLMSELLQEHIHSHVVQPADASQRLEGAEDLISVLKSYLK